MCGYDIVAPSFGKTGFLSLQLVMHFFMNCQSHLESLPTSSEKNGTFGKLTVADTHFPKLHVLLESSRL